MEKNADRIKYKCTNCNYEFTRKADLPIKVCPYCSRPDTLEMIKGDFASKVLDEVSRLDRISSR